MKQQRHRERHLFVCDCSSPEHQFIITEDEHDDDLYVAVHLSTHRFWRRLLVAWRYMCNRSGYWAFEEVLLDLNQQARLAMILNDRLNTKVQQARAMHELATYQPTVN